jgi:tripartite-type tricarboxylate transporter receptor subunit TctC
MKLPRRNFLHLAAGAAALPTVSRFAWAQAYPSRPVTLIVPYVAGGSTDVTMRALASATEKHLGRPIIIENRAGADGTLAPAQMAATAKPDGYTVAQFPSSVILAHFLRKTTYDPTKDFTYVIGVTGYTYGVVVRSDAPWRTFQDFLSNAKANPDKVNYATTGAATNPYATMELIAKQHGIKWVSVAFKGNGEQANALLGGHIHAIASSTGWGPQVNAGQFRLLVTWGASRTKSWPTVPTLRETGIDMVADEPYGIAGPKGMDPSVIKVLHDAFKKGMQEPSFLAMLDKLDQEVVYMSSDDYRDFAMKKIAETKRVVEELGLKEE